jgi:hypothetical protein
MFKPLNLDVACPVRFQEFVSRKLERHFLAPVHEMFRYPLKPKKAETLFEFTIANNLLTVVSGLSTLCYKQTSKLGDNRDRFKSTIVDHYPWAEEPSLQFTHDQWASEVYRTYRNSMAHALGVEKKGDRMEFLRIRIRSSDRIRGHSEKKLEAIELSASRPAWSATLRKDSSRTILHLEGFYWGVRKLIESLSASSARMAIADDYLSKKANW